MPAGDTPSLLEMVREHNRFNGYWFVVAEFVLVALAALLIAASGVFRHRSVIGFAGAGVAVNAAGIIAIAIRQIRDGEPNEGLLRLRSAEFRSEIRRKQPDLGAHTVVILVAVLIPFLLAALLLLEGHNHRN